MRLRNLLFIGALALSSSQANAQAWVQDSVTMGPGYANDVYYSLHNGTVKTEPNTNWHLAFQATPPGPYGNVSVLANHVMGGVNVYSLHMQASTNFTTLMASDTMGKTGASKALFNSDQSWNFGAFNRMNDATNPFDYSWGMYDMATHNVDGDSIYLVTVTSGPNTDAYKLWIKKFVSTPADSVQWQFRIAKFDGTGDTAVRIYRKPNYTDRLFAYYNITGKTGLDREPSRSAWDITFTRYKEYLVGAPGIPYYSVTGVLSNFDVTVAQKMHVVENDTVGTKTLPFSGVLNEIGSDWKVFNMTTNQYDIPDSNYYFIKVPSTYEYYQLQFTGFPGASSGKVFFRKRAINDFLSVNNVSSAVSKYGLVPNPANNDVSVVVDAKENVNSAKLMITDLTGKVVCNNMVNVKSGMNAFTIKTANLAAGTYVVTLTNGTWKATEKLVVQH